MLKNFIQERREREAKKKLSLTGDKESVSVKNGEDHLSQMTFVDNRPISPSVLSQDLDGFSETELASPYLSTKNKKVSFSNLKHIDKKLEKRDFLNDTAKEIKSLPKLS